MLFAKVVAFIPFACLFVFVFADNDDSQLIYLKRVQCKHNPVLLSNVSCFAKSYSRTISKATVMAVVKVPLTSVMVCNFS